MSHSSLRRSVALLLLFPLLGSCHALSDRARDAGDIFSCGMTFGLGAKVQVMPIVSTVGGVITFFEFKNSEFGEGRVTCGGSGDVGLGAWGSSSSEAPLPYQESNRGKDYVVTYSLVGVPEYEYSESAPRLRPFYTNVEVAAAALVGARAGFNPGELLDFFLGWFGVDIYGDDVSRGEAPPDEQQDDESSDD
ncbi:MAG: hypothetical protein L0Z55_08645 [Planctomycetes bacterium]|nr:hypothetical protein [Planctomycetota bacterium]